MKGAPGLIAVVLDEDTKAALRDFVLHPHQYCEHVTMAYRPEPDTYNKYKDMMGQVIEFTIPAIFHDECGEAAVVEGVMSENEVPHITISCAEGVKPSYSNRMFKNPNAAIFQLQRQVVGRGTVQWVPL